MSGRVPADTITRMFAEQVERHPTAAAFSYQHAGQWQSLTWQQVDRLVGCQADHLRRFGLTRGDRIGICGPPSWQWQVTELAAYRLGTVVVGIETRVTAEQIAHILAVSRIRLLVTQDADLVSKLPPAGQHGLEAVIRIPAEADPDLECSLMSEIKTLRGDGDSGTGRQALAEAETTDASALAPLAGDPMTIENATWLAQPVAPNSDPANDTLAKRQALAEHEVAPEDPATLVFTSGTTGTPKAIEYSHAQLALACRSLCQAFPELAGGGKYVCWLPMAHMFQRMMNYVAMAQSGHIFFQQDPREILTCLHEVQPEFFIAVPRLYEKLYEGIQGELAASNRLRRWLTKSAIYFGDRHARDVRRGRNSNPLWNVIHRWSDRLVLQRVRTLLGGKLRYMMTGSAPLSPRLLEFFHGLGWLVLEAYGVSENAVPMTVNRPQAYRFGSVGQPLPENEIRIAEDCEVLVRGPGVFSGYVGDLASEQPFTADGFYPTGDLGHFDDDGYLYLTGRKKEIIKTSTGRRISPARIERAYQQCPLVDHVVVVGDGRKHLAALVTPAATAEDLIDTKSTQLETAILKRFRSLDGDLEPHEQVHAIRVLEQPFSVSAGELTASLKIRRQVIVKRYAAVIDSMYS